MKKLLILGAGFSYNLGMPLAAELTEIFLCIFKRIPPKGLVNNLLNSNKFNIERPVNEIALNKAIKIINDYDGKNYEELLSHIQFLSETNVKTSTSDRDSYFAVYSICYSIIHIILVNYQIASFKTMYLKNRDHFNGLKNLLSKSETWVFTLNHDIYLECLSLDLGIPITYGDSEKITFPKSNIEMDNIIEMTFSYRNEFLEHNSFFKEDFGINLVKLHGGLSELHYDDGKKICNQSLKDNNAIELMYDFMNIQQMGYYFNGIKEPSGKDRVITDLKGNLDIICQAMMTGGKKYSITNNDKKGEEKLKLFSEILKQTDEVTVLGYGFGDKHINNRLSNAMLLNENLKIQIVDKVSRGIPLSLEQFDYSGRVRTATCGAAEWMEYVGTSRWNTDQIEGLKNNENLRNKIREKVKTLFPSC
ncbi:hypothetical protein [Thalassospira sp. 11-3]|uniref:hypothetical protein n=1 Tax=Thalassospira sp. 11-3 TaxID=2135614 RepID=UPI000D8DE16E|nr:hypothetical protein [Thalassospira sp. 11-3]PXX25866.1 hypothetical protein C7967_11810 [Thalassospira sp. 11-3]